MQCLGVNGEVLKPQRRTLADGSELSRLEMCERDGGKITLCGRKVAEHSKQGAQSAQEQMHPLPHQQMHPLPHHDQVRVVRRVCAGCAEMDEWTSGRGLVTEVVDVRHDIVPQAVFVAPHLIEICSVEVCAHLFEGLLRDVDPQAPLLFCQGEPQPTPQTRPVLGAPQALHGRGCVPGAERRLVPFGVAHRT
jgi:hypothetical protein